jgi:hypothetical protein
MQRQLADVASERRRNEVDAVVILTSDGHEIVGAHLFVVVGFDFMGPVDATDQAFLRPALWAVVRDGVHGPEAAEVVRVYVVLGSALPRAGHLLELAA